MSCDVYGTCGLEKKQFNFSRTRSYPSLDPLKSNMQSRPIKMQRMHSATIFRAWRASAVRFFNALPSHPPQAGRASLCRMNRGLAVSDTVICSLVSHLDAQEFLISATNCVYPSVSHGRLEYGYVLSISARRQMPFCTDTKLQKKKRKKNGTGLLRAPLFVGAFHRSPE